MRHTETPRATSARSARIASLVAAGAALLVAVLLIVADVSAEPSEFAGTTSAEESTAQ